jgi:hypothetical protein
LALAGESESDPTATSVTAARPNKTFRNEHDPLSDRRDPLSQHDITL